VVEGDKVRIFVTNRLPETPPSTGMASVCPMAWTVWAA
jgi:hypothetical protein